MNLKAELENLIRLQEIDTQIYSLRFEKAAKPAQIKALEEAFEAKKAHLLELEKNALELAKQKKEREAELTAKEE